jgi:3-phosphoglycerate kinase
MPCVSGLLVTKELNAFSQVIGDDVRCHLTSIIVGRAKIRDKILVIENLINTCIGCNHYLRRHGMYIHEGIAMAWRLESHYTIQKEQSWLPSS